MFEVNMILERQLNVQRKNYIFVTVLTTPFCVETAQLFNPPLLITALRPTPAEPACLKYKADYFLFRRT